MEESRLAMNEFFLDTSFAFALSSQKDELHNRATALANRIRDQGNPIITTQAVLLEIGNSLAKAKYRHSCVSLIENLRSDTSTIVVSISNEPFDDAFNLFRDRSDKEWGLVDCVSFVVMRERGINDALTADEHFVQAGFRALLREDLT